MKARLILSALLVASLSSCASSMVENGTCYSNMGACFLGGTAETIGYIAVAAISSKLDGDHDRRHDKKKRGH
ncbi:MAG TPA: hypothetical protein VL199_13890 [Burkholderiales bacterium]|jgi:hypothetical protein|nr:hypothetical protein [Burkholderiales bacterium]